MTISTDDLRSAGNATFALLLMRGLLALAFGLLALFFPVGTTKALIFAFGIFSIIDGVFALLAAFVLRGEKWGWVAFTGALGVFVGVIAMRFPQTAAFAILLLIAVWALMAGAFQISGSFSLKSLGHRQWYWLLITGVVSAGLGLLLLFNPVTGIKSIVLLLAVFALLYGALLVLSAFATRSAVNAMIAD